MTDSNIDQEEVKKATKKLNAYLIEHPEMLLVQEEIERSLEKANGNVINKCIILQTLLTEESKKLMDLNKELMLDVRQLVNLTRKTHEELNRINEDLYTLSQTLK